MDENFDGRISYKELRDHIRSLGFIIDNEPAGSKTGTMAKGGAKAVTTHVWRDKGIEVAIRVLHHHLNKKPFEEFFKNFDGDHDNHLTPSEFR